MLIRSFYIFAESNCKSVGIVRCSGAEGEYVKSLAVTFTEIIAVRSLRIVRYLWCPEAVFSEEILGRSIDLSYVSQIGKVFRLPKIKVLPGSGTRNVEPTATRFLTVKYRRIAERYIVIVGVEKTCVIFSR